MKKNIISILKLLGLYKTFKVPIKVKKNFIELEEEKKTILLEHIEKLCSAENYCNEENRLSDIDALYTGRLSKFRKTHIPFLIEKIGLIEKDILEIGCGSGSSTIALQEQGCNVTAIDINEEYLNIARKRADIYDLAPDFFNVNALDIYEFFKGKKFDIIIFYASLEHMLPQERKESLKQAYQMLKEDGCLCIFGTPNRLWPFDQHTSNLPFYMWLQDEIAIDYARYSDRKEFSSLYKKNRDSAYSDIYRWGRGVSYHELDVALGAHMPMKVIGSLPEFLRCYSFLQKLSYRMSDEYKLKKLLSNFASDRIHEAFFECYLDIILQKQEFKIQ